ncbi:MAG: hypothetical protein VKO26_00085 [Cyanobacteriota bacterium]|nr:hypothetical protein [Cyanobacteriota bacterium]
MEVAELVEDLKGRLRTLQTKVFPQQVLLELHDTRVLGQTLLNGQAGPLAVDLPLPAKTCKSGLPIESEALADAIGELMLREKLIDAHVMAALPPEAVHWRVLDWNQPPAAEEAIATLRDLDPELGFPFPLSEASIDVRPLGASADKLLLAATSRQVVDGWVEVFDQAGLNLERLAPPQSCRLAALGDELAAVPPEALVVVIAPQETRGRPFLALRAGIPLFERVLVEKGDQLVAEIQRCVTFLRREFADVHDLRLLLEGPMEEQSTLEAHLGQPMRALDVRPFGSLVMAGLAIPEPLL